MSGRGKHRQEDADLFRAVWSLWLEAKQRTASKHTIDADLPWDSGPLIFWSQAATIFPYPVDRQRGKSQKNDGRNFKKAVDERSRSEWAPLRRPMARERVSDNKARGRVRLGAVYRLRIELGLDQVERVRAEYQEVYEAIRSTKEGEPADRHTARRRAGSLARR
jgi:hypothetical protein